MCRWDSWLLDVLICNWIGIVAGMWCAPEPKSQNPLFIKSIGFKSQITFSDAHGHLLSDILFCLPHPPFQGFLQTLDSVICLLLALLMLLCNVPQMSWLHKTT